MLEQQLAEAKALRRKQLLKLSLGFITVVVIIAGAFIFTSCCYTGGVDKDEILTELSDTGQTKPNNHSLAETIPAETNSSDEALRQQYITLISEYENQLQPQLAKIELNKWDAVRGNELQRLKQAALSAFSQANYQDALAQLQQASTLATALINDSQNAFATAFSKAESAYANDDYQTAKLQIDQALMLDRESVEAVELANKTQQLPALLPLLENIQAARIENNYRQERDYLTQLIELAPEREGLVERKQELTTIINNQRYESLVAQAYQAVKKGDAGKARKRLESAQRIYSNRSELSDISSSIAELERKQRLEKHLQSAQSAMASDQWTESKQYLTLALREDPNDKSIQQSLEKTNTILELNQLLSQHINNPYRLSSQQSSANADAVISKAERFRSDSPSLSRQADELAVLLEKMNNKVSVDVRSDNQTNVLVRGVGIVGVTEMKTIQLLPGYYTFEGKRKGYKSKLIDVLVPYDKATISLTVICDEPI